MGSKSEARHLMQRLGVPVATELAGALRDRGLTLPGDVLTIDDAVEAMWTSSNSPAA